MHNDPQSPIIDQRSAGMPAQRPHWQRLATELQVLGNATAGRLLLALPTLRTGNALLAMAAKDGDKCSALQDFFTNVDASEETLAEWLAALQHFIQFLESRGQQASLRQATGYLHCCLAMVQSGPRYESFPSAVVTFLDVYGFSDDHPTEPCSLYRNASPNP